MEARLGLMVKNYHPALPRVTTQPLLTARYILAVMNLKMVNGKEHLRPYGTTYFKRMW